MACCSLVPICPPGGAQDIRARISGRLLFEYKAVWLSNLRCKVTEARRCVCVCCAQSLLVNVTHIFGERWYLGTIESFSFAISLLRLFYFIFKFFFCRLTLTVILFYFFKFFLCRLTVTVILFFLSFSFAISLLRLFYFF